jgi:hypothetical protein
LSQLATFTLSELTRAPTYSGIDGSALHVPIEGSHLERCLLFVGELDVPDPTAD